MISVQKAESLIKDSLKLFPTELIPLEDSSGRVLAEPIVADRDYPPFHRVCMDGIAIDYKEYNLGQRIFHNQAIQQAGDAIETLASTKNCIQIMTGAALPENTDTIIRIEDLVKSETSFEILENSKVNQNQNIHSKGSDYKKGQELLSPMTRINETHMAILASVGKSAVQVFKLPEIALISTGNELVHVSQTPAEIQVRISNSHAIRSSLNNEGLLKADIHQIRDEYDVLKKELSQLLEQKDVLILSGGVSMGEFDLIPKVLQELGVEQIFHKIKQRPGKPMWFGKTSEGKLVFALPGNPVSAIVCYRRYVLPALYFLTGRKQKFTDTWKVTLKENVNFKPDLTYFLPVTLIQEEDGKIVSHPRPTNGSGDFASLANSDGFIELNAESKQDGSFSKGLSTPFYSWS